MDFHHKFIVLNKKQKNSRRFFIYISFILVLVVLYILILYVYRSSLTKGTTAEVRLTKNEIPRTVKADVKQGLTTDKNIALETIETKLVDGKDYESIDGISDLVTAVVECSTTKGKVTIDVRAGWSPLGAEHYLKLVQNGLFTDLPFTRVCPHYITQFGTKYNKWADVKKDPELTGSIADDPSLWGKRDMDFGYLFYAGGGKNSRSDEMVIALCDKPGCKLAELGRAEWEVPIGTIRKEGFQTLLDIADTGVPYPRLEMIGQHPNAGGPDLGKIYNDPNYLKENYPYMDYWQICTIVRTDIQEIRPLSLDHPPNELVNNRPRSYKKVPKAILKDEATDTTNVLNVASGATAAGAVGEGETGPGSAGKLNIRGGKGRFASRFSKKTMSTGLNASSEEKPVKLTKHHGLITVSMSIRPGLGDTRKVLNKHSEIVIEIMPEWSPLGAERFEELVKAGHFDDCRFFRVIKKFMAQFGSKGSVFSKAWPAIPDEPLVQTNSRGTLSFASSGPNTRSTQLFINLVNNRYLDDEKFTPVARVVSGMDVIGNIFDGYGEGGAGDGYDGKGPSQGRIAQEGNEYLNKYFPKMSYIEKAHLYKNFE